MMRMHALLLSVLMLSPAGQAEVQASDISLPSINSDAVTVSGVSAGGAMAQQMHLVYADRIRGAGIIAGVPFGCAEGQLGLALGRCMGKEPGEIPIDGYVQVLRDAAARGAAADPALLEDHRAWLFHGTLDAAVGASATDATVALYEALLPSGQVQYVNEFAAAHHFPTLASGAPCDQSAPPWLGACDFDAAGELLSFLYDGLEAPTADQRAASNDGALQKVALPGAATAGLSEAAWLFVPETCPAEGCRLHVALHGCAMSTIQNGRAFIEDSGYLPWARANGIVLAFPEVAAQPLNPLGCWDWWGYTGPNYLERDGAQMKVMADWIAALTTP